MPTITGKLSAALADRSRLESHLGAGGLALLAVLGTLSGPVGVAAQRGSSAESGVKTVVPLPAVFYQPETGTAFGAVLGVYGNRGRQNRTSETLLSFIYTSKKQILTGVNLQQYPDNGRFWVTGSLEYRRFPTKFWGLGNDTPELAEEDYTPRSVLLNLEVQRSIAPDTYAGFVLEGRRRRLSVVAPGGQLAAGPGTGSQSSVGGVGVVGSRDTRDRRLAPERGSLLVVRMVASPAALTNDAGFTRFRLDARRYVPTRPGHTIAARILLEATGGNAPFDYLPALGGDRLLRGYYEGRFRDRHLMALESGYRFPLAWIVRGAAFAGIGQVAPALEDLTLARFKTSLGGGLRFVIDRDSGAAIRVDYAWAVDVGSGGLYFGLGEAF